jgi:hypothetical protein
MTALNENSHLDTRYCVIVGYFGQALGKVEESAVEV